MRGEGWPASAPAAFKRGFGREQALKLYILNQLKLEG